MGIIALENNRRIVFGSLAAGAVLLGAFAGNTPLGATAKKAAPQQAAPLTASSIGLAASLFATARTGPVNNVALLWDSSVPCDSFDVFRAETKAGKPGTFTRLFSGQGASFNDYGLKAGTYSYKLVARRGAEEWSSNLAQVTTLAALPSDVVEISNQTGDGVGALWEPVKVGDTYYRFDSEKDGETSRRFIVKTSRDGKTWKTGPVVLDKNSHPDLADFKFEAGSPFYDKVHHKFLWWCHWERAKGYNDGRAFVATATPGQPFTVHHIYNPLGIQVRDMSVFIDDDKQGYLVAASNVAKQGANATLTVFKLNSDYTDVTGIVSRAMENQYREAPHIVHRDGIYYLFFSQAAGWYPSRAGYVAAKSLGGPWSAPRDIGNTSTFAAQSGAVIPVGGEKPSAPLVLVGNRWIKGEGTSGNSIVPVHCAGGFALGDYSPTLLLSPAKDKVIPLQMGRLLSQNQPATATIAGSAGHEIGKAFDGDYNTAFQSDDKKWPFSVTTDLGTICAVRNVQISWHIHKGSEAFYKYTIEGSRDGTTWSVLLDRTDEKDSRVSKTYGFSSDVLPNGSMARYVRINVQNAVLHNNPNNWYPPTLYEVKVYGDPARKVDK